MKKKGFTLVEIMVVVSIVVLLVGIALMAGSSAKSAARDNQRKTDISLLQLKLEAYRGQIGVYPGTGGWNDLIDQSFISTSTLPRDPSTKSDYIYIPLKFTVGGDCTNGIVSYYLYATLENNNSKHAVKTGLSSCGNAFPGDLTKIYDVVSPGAFKN